MTFDGKNAEKYCELAGFSHGINARDCHVATDRFYDLVQKLLDLPELTFANDVIRLGLLLEYIGLAIESNQTTEAASHKERLYSTDTYVEYAANYIQANYATVKIGEVASYVGLHRSYLTNIFKKKLGVSPQEYLMQCRLKRAGYLLLSSDLPIQEISRIVGYENPLTFSKMFKSFYGVSPKLYRQQNDDTSGQTT